MRYWSYNEPVELEYNDYLTNFVVTKSEDEIVSEYYEYWKERMKAIGKEDNISIADCIEDWVIIHWAWESTED